MVIGKLTLVLSVPVVGMAMLSAPAAAQGSLGDQMAVCARIAKTSARTACYDSIPRGQQSGAVSGASNFGAETVRTPAAPPPPAPRPAPAPAPAAVAGFGAEQVERAAPQRAATTGANEIEVAVRSAHDNGLHMWQFTLADGAVWRMTERASAGFRPPAPNETVSIRKASLGSYLMNIDRQPSVRVERVR